MKKTCNQNFIIRRVKQKSRATTLVYVRITVDGARTEVSLQRECDPDRWDPDKGRLSGKTEEVKSINAYLDAVQLKIYDIFQTFISTGVDFDGEKLKARYLGFDVEKPRSRLLTHSALYFTWFLRDDFKCQKAWNIYTSLVAALNTLYPTPSMLHQTIP